VFNKKLFSFINDMCMKMFFAIVNNNTEKSAQFSESSEYLSIKRKLFIFNVWFIIFLRFPKYCNG